MSPIKRVVFDPEWLEAYLCEFFGCTVQVFSTKSLFKKDIERKATCYFIMHSQADLEINQMVKRYHASQTLVWEMVNMGKKLTTTDKRTLISNLNKYIPVNS